MALTINIKGKKTPVLGTSPCDKCEYFSEVKGALQNQHIMICSNFGRLKFKPVECTEFRATGTMSRRSMEEVAWIMEVKPNRQIGFIAATEWRKKHKDDDIIPNSSPYFG